MSNYPENFKGTNMDVTPEQQEAGERIDQIHKVYRDMLSALQASCIKNRVMPTKLEVEIIMEAVGESLADEAHASLEVLPGLSYVPDNSKQLVEQAHEAIVDSMRVKSLDWNAAFNNMFRPVPTNPATPGFMDAEDGRCV